MPTVSDILGTYVDEIHRVFYNYCEVAMEGRVALDNKTAALTEFLLAQNADPGWLMQTRPRWRGFPPPTLLTCVSFV